ncbi:hypothetical protein [Streptomyces sp. NBC_01500]|uniref:hypothetical protein n=1 Tax=Streptomyces sp. NBC_01500 TaxID=2903886 RepID=UPI00225AB548|nr:hypothetical protein [Streptomyces sp. NBC_01500]MCX4553142.1 hypothetical protein [Streptomyces sp. NBC_01500]
MDLGEPVYGSVPGAGPVFFRHEIPTAYEPLYRAFFTELAHLADRPIASYSRSRAVDSYGPDSGCPKHRLPRPGPHSNAAPVAPGTRRLSST